MDAAGATAASVVSLTHTRDLVGMRTSHLPGSTYTHDVYSADFKISGLGRRLGVNLGPLRWLLFSVTYGSKGYRVRPEIELQRQIGPCASASPQRVGGRGSWSRPRSQRNCWTSPIS